MFCMEVLRSARLRETHRLPFYGPGEITYSQIGGGHGQIDTHTHAHTRRDKVHTPLPLNREIITWLCADNWKYER